MEKNKVKKMTNEIALSGLEEMRSIYKMSETIARSDIIPAAFKNKPENVFIAYQLALRMNVPALEIMQNIHIIKGKPSFSSSYLIARANESGYFTQPIQYEITHKNNDITITAYTYLKTTSEKITATVSLDMAKKEGWATREGNKYGTMPEQLLCYRAGVFLVRRHVPQVMLGFMAKEEVEDISLQSASAREKLNAKIAQKLKVTESNESTFIQEIDSQFEAKESQLEDSEVTVICQE